MSDKSLPFFKALADKSRLQIIGALQKQPLYVEVLSERLKLSASTVSFHLKKLEDAGIVESYREQYYMMYKLNEEILALPVRDFIAQKSSEIINQDKREDAYRKKVLNAFFEYGKLKTIPVQQKKRRIVLEQILQGFEPERKYTEKEVNLIIADYHDDFCFIRREFISENLMMRADGLYWRIE